MADCCPLKCSSATATLNCLNCVAPLYRGKPCELGFWLAGLQDDLRKVTSLQPIVFGLTYHY